MCDLWREVKELKNEVRELKKLIQVNNDTAQGPTYAAVARGNVPISTVTGKCPRDKPGGTKQQQRLRVEDDKCSITVNTSRVKDEKLEFGSQSQAPTGNRW